MDLGRELLIAEELARKAGRMALDLQKNLTITEKDNGEGPVTNADLAIDNFIVEGIKNHFPDDKIISEEGYYLHPIHSVDVGRTWFVDPIDGTSSYMVGDDDFVVMIGLSIDGEPCLGVVYQPARDRLWRGIANHPSLAEKIERGVTSTIALRPQKKDLDDLTIIASRIHSSRRQRAMILAIKPKRVRYQSSVGLKAMLILDGYADLYVAWSKRIKMWDTCAPFAIVKAACASMSFIDGTELIFLNDINHGKQIMIAGFTPSQELINILKDIASTDL